MISSFEVGSVFTIIDKASPTIEKLARRVSALGKLIRDTKAELIGLGNTKIGKLDANLKTLTDRMIALSEAVEKSNASMVGATDAAAASARTLAAEWGNVAKAARAAAASATAPSLNPSVVRSPRNLLGGGGHRGYGLGVTGPGIPGPGGTHIRMHGAGNAAMLGAGALAYGVYEQSELDRDAARAMYIYNNGNLPDRATQLSEEQQFRDMIMKSAGDTGKSFHDLSEVALTDIRQRANDPNHPTSWGRLMQGMPGLLVTASQESDIKGNTIEEAGDSLVAFAHMLKIYDPVEMQKLYPALAYYSMHSPQTLKRITTAAGYHLPTTTSGLDVDPIQEMGLQVALERAGVLNTKSGTWLREMALRALPEVKGVVSDKDYYAKQNLLQSFGLVDKDGKPAWFTDGKPDELKLLQLVGHNAEKMKPEIRAKMERYLFGAQGAGAIAVLSDPRVQAQLDAMVPEARAFKSGTDYFKFMVHDSPVQQFNQTWVDLQKVLMDTGSVALPAVIASLRIFDTLLNGIASRFPNGGGQKFGTGMTLGASVGGAIGWAAGQPLLGAAIGAGIGADTAHTGKYTGGGFLGAVEDALKLGWHFLVGSGSTDIEKSTRDGTQQGAREGVEQGLGKLNLQMPAPAGTGSVGVSPTSYHDPLIPPHPSSQPVLLHNVIQLDGRVVARNTMKYIVHDGNGPASGARLPDYMATRQLTI